MTELAANWRCLYDNRGSGYRFENWKRFRAPG